MSFTLKQSIIFGKLIDTMTDYEKLEETHNKINNEIDSGLHSVAQEKLRQANEDIFIFVERSFFSYKKTSKIDIRNIRTSICMAIKSFDVTRVPIFLAYMGAISGDINKQYIKNNIDTFRKSSKQCLKDENIIK